MAGPAPAKGPGQPAASPPPVVILADDPTSIDELGGHSRVASAIAALIRQGVDSGRSIALTGSWGSGKSSVIRMLSEQLESVNTDRPPVLLFDAWSYQGDPLRRAFLERFIEHAARLEPKIDTERIKWPERKGDSLITRRQLWTENLDLVTGRRESSESRADRPLTGWGLAVAISLLLCLPLGGAFLSRYDPSKYAFWKSNFAWAFVITYSIPIIITVIAWMCGRFKPDALKALLLREATQDTSTTTVKTREPSSVDFQRLFAEIASYLLCDSSRRLVIVIDNLDRIDAEAAVTMWATMRVFFDPGLNPPAWQKRVWLIVPFDRTALAGLWQSKDGKDAGANFVDSFLNKTFQIAFHVSPPVLTTWKRYFQNGLNTAFPGVVQTTERDAIYELFALKHASPSPREIKIFINKVAALRLLWSGAEQIELPFLAAYVLHQKEIRADGEGLLLGDVLSREAVSILMRYKPGVDWGEQLSAAHFNVSPSVAIQVLMDSRFSVALAAGNNDALASLRKSANFWTVFERFSQGQLTKWQEPHTLARIVQFLIQSESEEKDAAPFISRIWPTVLSSAGAISNWGDIVTPETAAVLPRLLGKTPDGDLSAIASGILKYLQSAPVNSASFVGDNVKTWIGAVGDTLAEIQKRPAHAPLAQNFQVTVTPQVYIFIATAALGLDAALPTLQHVDCSRPADVPLALMAALSATEEEIFLRLKGALESSVPAGWDAFDAAVINALPTLTAKDTVTAMRATLRPRTGRPDMVPLLEQVSKKMGPEKFAEFESKGQWREAGVLAVVGLIAVPPILPPSLIPDKSTETSSAPQLIESMADALSEFDLSSKIFAPGFPSGLTDPLLDAIVRKGRFDDLHPEAVIAYHKDRLAGASGDVIAPAAKSDKFLQHVLERAVLSLDQYPFYIAWLKALPVSSRENAALRLGPLMPFQPVAPVQSVTTLLNEIFDAGGVAWLPLLKASEFLTELAESKGSTIPAPALEKLTNHLSSRISLGDRTVEQLLDAAEKAAPSVRDSLRDLAIDRARGDYAVAAGDRHASLLAWGDALLARARRGPWQTARPFAERAQRIFEMAGQP